jgi:D-ribulokinase
VLHDRRFAAFGHLQDAARVARALMHPTEHHAVSESTP